MNDYAIIVFTHRSPDGIKADGGSKAWVLNPKRAKLCKWVVCTQNLHSSHERSDANKPHGSAFLVGKISGLTKAPEADDRWLIRISEYAEINIPSAWKGWQNPVHYGSLAELGIDLAPLQFKPMPPTEIQTATNAQTATSALTISEAKIRLAASLGVSPEAVEITVKA